MAVDRYKNRYEGLKVNSDGYKLVPGIFLNVKSTDILITHKRGRIKFDELSQKYYGNPQYGWVIMLANSRIASLEWDIADNSVIIIPFPLLEHLNDYNRKIEQYNNLNK